MMVLKHLSQFVITKRQRGHLSCILLPCWTSHDTKKPILKIKLFFPICLFHIFTSLLTDIFITFSVPLENLQVVLDRTLLWTLNVPQGQEWHSNWFWECFCRLLLLCWAYFVTKRHCMKCSFLYVLHNTTMIYLTINTETFAKTQVSVSESWSKEGRVTQPLRGETPFQRVTSHTIKFPGWRKWRYWGMK